MPKLHPDIEAFLELAADAPRLEHMPVAHARAAYDRASLSLDGVGPNVPVTALTLPSRAGHPLPARLYRGARDDANPSPVLLYFHGGGYVLGGLDSHDTLCRSLAHEAGCAVLAVAYRLAPEHRFPAAFEDAEDAHAWLLAQGHEAGLDVHRIAVGGDSVGGTLATALCLAAQASNRPQPVLQLLIYPCTSGDQRSASHERYASGHLLEASTLRWMYAQVLRGEADRSDWRFAPLQRTSLVGIAPAHIALAEHDPLVDEGLAYAERLRRDGVPVTLKVYDGMVHDFARLGNVVDDARTLRADLAHALATAIDRCAH